MKKLPFWAFALLLLFMSCTGRDRESCSRSIDRKTDRKNYHIQYYGMVGAQLIQEDYFYGFLHNDEGVDLWYYKGDTCVQILRGDFGTTVVKSW